MSKCYIYKYYLTLKELINFYSSTPIKYYGAPTFKSVLTSNGEFNIDNARISLIVNNSYVEKLWQSIIAKYGNEYIQTSKSVTSDNYIEESTLILNYILNTINETYDRYTTLLGAYDTKQHKLLDAIVTEQEGFARFNDTPQNGGLFADDNHTTNITQTTGKTSTEGRAIERLKEIQEAFSNVFQNWLNEFHKFFVEGGNLEDGEEWDAY